MTLFHKGMTFSGTPDEIFDLQRRLRLSYVTPAEISSPSPYTFPPPKNDSPFVVGTPETASPREMPGIGIVNLARSESVATC